MDNPLPIERTETVRSTSLRRLAITALVGLTVGCGVPSRFALRPPVLREDDNRPFTKIVERDEESAYANAIDGAVFRTLSNAVRYDSCGPARNVNSIDEVPESTWFTNRRLASGDLERGPCAANGPVLPFTIKSANEDAGTAEFSAVDANGEAFTLKLDSLGPRQPEVTTAANAIVSRLYWAMGYNAPCNNVMYVRDSDLEVDEEAEETFPTGRRDELSHERLTERLKTATRHANGEIRLLASRPIAGTPVGTWRGEGKRDDDPNDVIAHQHRRELRAERLLAAWVNHWDSSGPNTHDAFVPAPSGGGYIVHYFLEFGESLGGGKVGAEPRHGYTSVLNTVQIATDTLTLGLVRRPWDGVKVDPLYPNLGYLDVDHFDPMGFSPLIPLVRWSCAQPQDLAWMARRIASVDSSHIRVAVDSGKLTNPKESARLADILVGRRAKLLRASFSGVSPLTNVAITGLQLCASDLGIATGLSTPAGVSYEASFRTVSPRHRSPLARKSLADAAQACFALPPHFARPQSRDDSEERYAVVDIVRIEGSARTTLSAYLYDLGDARGYVLAGVERP